MWYESQLQRKCTCHFCHYLEISRTLLGGLSAVFALCFLGVKQKKTTFFSCSDEDFIDFLANNKTINFYQVCHSGWCSRLYSNGKTKMNGWKNTTEEALPNPSEQREQYESILSMSACWNVLPNESRVLRAKIVSRWLDDFLSPFFRGFQRKRLEISCHSTAFSKHVLLSRHGSSASVVIEKKKN